MTGPAVAAATTIEQVLSIVVPEADALIADGEEPGPDQTVLGDDGKPITVNGIAYDLGDFTRCDGPACDVEYGIGVIEGITGQRTCRGLFCPGCLTPCHAECGPWDR